MMIGVPPHLDIPRGAERVASRPPQRRLKPQVRALTGGERRGRARPTTRPRLEGRQGPIRSDRRRPLRSRCRSSIHRERVGCGRGAPRAAQPSRSPWERPTGPQPGGSSDPSPHRAGGGGVRGNSPAAVNRSMRVGRATGGSAIARCSVASANAGLSSASPRGVSGLQYGHTDTAKPSSSTSSPTGARAGPPRTATCLAIVTSPAAISRFVDTFTTRSPQRATTLLEHCKTMSSSMPFRERTTRRATSSAASTRSPAGTGAMPARLAASGFASTSRVAHRRGTLRPPLAPTRVPSKCRYLESSLVSVR